MATSLFEQEIDLNELFHMNYNFDLLKSTIQILIKSNKDLEKRLSSIESKALSEANEKINNSERFDLITSRLEKTEKDISDIFILIEKFNKTSSQTKGAKDADEKAENSTENSKQIELRKTNILIVVTNRIDKIDRSIEELELKISSVSLLGGANESDGIELSDSDKFLRLLENLKETVFKRLNKIGDKVDTNKLYIDNFKGNIESLNENKRRMKESIELLFKKIEELQALVDKSSGDHVY